MLGNATQRLIHHVDKGGDLIAVTRQNDSEKLKMLAVVMKRPAVFFWQSTKYKPTAFTLNDLLLEDTIETVVDESEFLSFEEKRKIDVAGSLGAGAAGANLNVEGQKASTSASSLGTLRKEAVKIPKLHIDSRKKKVDLEHSLIKQSLGKSQCVFTLVVERIFTSRKCTLVLEQEGRFGNSLKVPVIYAAVPEISLEQSFGVKCNKNVSVELPEGSVLAYSVTEMKIQPDGSYELSAFSGGFSPFFREVQLKEEEVKVVEGPDIQKDSSLSVLKEGLARVKPVLSALAQLPVPTRSSLLLLFRQILLDRHLLSCLEDKLEMFCRNLSIPLDDVSETPIKDFLDLLSYSSRSVTDQTGSGVKSSDPRCSFWMLVSAADDLKDEGLVLLESLCSPEDLCGLKDLVNLLTDSDEPLPCDRLPAALQSDAQFQKVADLFSSSGVTLRREGQLCAETESATELLPACVAIHGLAYLSQDL